MQIRKYQVTWWTINIILVPRATILLSAGTKSSALSNTGSLRFTDFLSNLANLIGWEYETFTLHMLRKSGPARALDLCRRSEGSWLWGREWINIFLCHHYTCSQLATSISNHFQWNTCNLRDCGMLQFAQSKNFPCLSGWRWLCHETPAEELRASTDHKVSGLSWRAGHWVNWLALSRILPAWFFHLEESFSYNKV